MKNYYYSMTLIGAILLVFACGGNAKQESNNEVESEVVNTIEEQAEDEAAFGEAKDCDEFIDQYEVWMNDYIDMLDKYMKNPMDATLMQDYMKLAEEATTWMTQWNTKLVPCSSKEKYQKRFDEISEKAEKKLEAMGIE